MKKLLIALLCLGLVMPAQARVTGTQPTADDRFCAGGDGSEFCLDDSGDLIPTTDNADSLGISSLRWADVQTMDMTLGDDLTVTDDLAVNGDSTLGDASADVFDINAGTITVSNQVYGLVIATHTSTGGPVQTIMKIDGENRRICVNCLSSEAPSDALQVLDDGVALGAGTPTGTIGEGDLYVTDDAEIDSDLTVDGAITVATVTASQAIRRTLPTAQVIGAGGIILADGCGGVKLISSAAGVTTDTTNTFTAPAAGNAGCFMVVCNTNASDTITLDDNANFIANGSADIVLGAEDCVAVVSSGAGGVWRSVSGISAN